MARPRKPGGQGSKTESTDIVLTKLQKTTRDFAALHRRVRTADGTEELTHFEIMQRKQFESGIAGNSVSQRDFIRRAEIAEQAHQVAVTEDCRRWSLVKQNQIRRLALAQAEARATGMPLVRILPHPDDILIDPEQGVTILGPIDEVDWTRFDEQVRLRDALYVQQAMEDAVENVPMNKRPSSRAALVAAMLLNRWLPPSLRLSDSDQGFRIGLLRGRSKRDALLQCRAMWKRAGIRTTRGKRFGTLETFLPMMDALRDMVVADRIKAQDPLGAEEALQHAARAVGAFFASSVTTSACPPKTQSTQSEETA